MIQCKKCGYQNNDGSTKCINCKSELGYIYKSNSVTEYLDERNMVAESDEENVKIIYRRIIIIGAVLFLSIFIIGLIVWAIGNVKPIDERLVGSWGAIKIGNTYSQVWTFESTGDLQLEGMMESEPWEYTAEEGKLTVIVNEGLDIKYYYEYQLGVTDDGRECLIMKKLADGSELWLFRIK